MAVLSITGKAIPRSSIYSKPTQPLSKQRKQRKLSNHPTLKPKHAISEQQARMIIDKQIATKLRQMFY